MAMAALIVTVAIAAAGWIITQAQARRATRRNMRINYLLDAYRRLDRASNRPLTPATAPDIEAAISDITLLGTPQQALLAGQFARAFATSHHAEAIPLLQDLRASLRRELLLEQLPADTYVSLRVDTIGDTAPTSARIWRDTAQTTRQAIDAELASLKLAPGLVSIPGREPAADSFLSPSAVIAVNTQQVEHALRGLLTSAAPGELNGLNIAQLANRALQLGLIDSRLADTLNGLNVMRLLAATAQDHLSREQAAEFTALSTVAHYLIETSARGATTTPGNASCSRHNPNQKGRRSEHQETV